jgi:DNA processing protein
MADPPSDKPYFLAFARVKGIGPARLRRLLARFGTLEAAWKAEEMELVMSGLDQKSLEALGAARRAIDPDAELEALARSGIGALTWVDPDYPRLLRQIADPPPALYVKGDLREADAWAVAIVGTRRASVYGREVAEMLASDFARSQVTVVSGLARGIDAAAHQAALSAGGRTVAVLGSGVDVVYPAEHRQLAHAIAAQGALVSDYPPGTQPEAVNFPPRNRIISGLSLGTVVVEADERSGALITVDFALDQGRDVFAVPGNIFNRTSRGTNQLIQKGAKLVMSAADVLDDLNLGLAAQHAEVQAAAPADAVERRVLEALTHEPAPVDEVVRGLGLPAETVAAALALLELKGLARQAGGARYALTRAAGARAARDGVD